jgi:hypothetical protein
MAGATAAIAGAMAQARRRVLAHFESQNAISAETAVAYVPEQRMERNVFAQMQRQGIIASAGDDRWYFDEAAYDAQQAAIRRSMKWVALIALIGFGIAFLIHAFTH